MLMLLFWFWLLVFMLLLLLLPPPPGEFCAGVAVAVTGEIVIDTGLTVTGLTTPDDSLGAFVYDGNAVTVPG